MIIIPLWFHIIFFSIFIYNVYYYYYIFNKNNNLTIICIYIIKNLYFFTYYMIGYILRSDMMNYIFGSNNSKLLSELNTNGEYITNFSYILFIYTNILLLYHSEIYVLANKITLLYKSFILLFNVLNDDDYDENKVLAINLVSQNTNNNNINNTNIVINQSQ